MAYRHCKSSMSVRMPLIGLDLMHGNSAKVFLNCKYLHLFYWGKFSGINCYLSWESFLIYFMKMYLSSQIKLISGVTTFQLSCYLHFSLYCAFHFRDLSYNQLTRLDEFAFIGVNVLEKLNLSDSRLSYIADGVFKGLSYLQTL